MIEEKELRRYIIRRFVLTLLVVGVVEFFVSFLFSTIIGPFLYDVLEIEMKGQGLNSSDIALIAFEILLLVILGLFSRKASFVSAGFLEEVFKKIFDTDISITTLFERLMEIIGEKDILYIFVIFVCCFLGILVWIGPYIVAVTSFSKAVTKRFRILEEKRIRKDHEQIKQRNLLLSDIAHDIKTPITTIAGFSQALKDGTVEEEKKQVCLDSIYEKSMKTVELVDLLFEYVKLESEGFTLHKTTEDIFELLRGCVANCYTDFEKKNMKVQIDIPEETCYLQVDRVQIERAISNLLVNAWKHNEINTEIWVQAMKQEDRVLLRILDNGKIIEKETAKHLFDPFVQGDKSRTGNRGSGLGLSICRKIIEMHDGSIRLVQYLNQEEENVTKAFEIFL